MNLRNTHQKQAILEAIQGIGKHMSAEQVLSEVQKTDPGIGLATVYRNLNRLAEQGRIQKIAAGDVSFYDGNPVPHDHFQCELCGKVTDIDMKYDASMDQMAEKQSGMKILRHSVLYEGICADCAEKEKKQSWN